MGERVEALPPGQMQAEQWQKLDRSRVWHPFSQMSEYDGLIIDSASGCWLTDIRGKKYFDGVSSLWCNVHGHCHPHIDQAVRRQLDRVAHVTSLGMSSPVTIELADRLCQIAPEGLEHVFFSSDGSSSVEVALKLAFQYWHQCVPAQSSRTTYLALGNSYHGDTLGSVAVGGVARFHAMFHPLLFPVMRGPCPDTYRLPDRTGPDEACSYYLRHYRSILERHSQRIAAVVIEPLLQGAAGMVMHPPGFLSGIRKLCDEFDVLMIADEIAVGFGRTGRMFACEQEQVSPDLLCLAKGLTGGYLPMSATLATTRIWNAFLGEYAESKSFFHGHTYGGNPLASAAAMATLDVFEMEKTLEQLPEKMVRLKTGLEPLRDHPQVGDVRQCGLIAAVELVENKKSKAPYAWHEKRGVHACRKAIEMGVWLRPLGNVIPIMPPLSATLEEIDLVTEAVRAGVVAATEPGRLSHS